MMMNKVLKKRQLTNLLARDTLTKLRNRFSLYHSLRKLTSKPNNKDTCFSVIMIDIDRFSHLNQRLGQVSGDQVLKQVGARLKKLVEKEEYLARLGNDEFVIIYKKENLKTLPAFIETIEKIINKPICVNKEAISLTASIGVSIFPKHSLDADELMELARVALFHSKELGGNKTCHYTRYLPHPNKIELDLEDEISQAQKKEQLHVYYQPIFSIIKNRVIGFEALLRWMHPTKGLLLPYDFLPFCERTNLIVSMGEWVLSKACEELSAWHRLGFPELHMSINISARQLYYPGFLEFVTDFVKNIQFPATSLEFEVTETAIMKDIESVIPILKGIRDLGIQLSLDDFGTGYSSLTYLKKFPFNNIKIDRSFVNEMCQSSKDSAIIDTIMLLGNSLGLGVIAEGVETREQVTLLQAKKCDLLQGFFYSKPMPSNMVINYLSPGKTG